MTYTFAGIKSEISDRLSLLSDWARTIYFSAYDRILDVIAYITEKLAYLAEFYYAEANWSTATRLDSIMQKVKWLVYSPHRKTGASGNISLSASSVFSASYTYTGESVVIPKRTSFENADGDVFVYSTEEKIYYKNTIGSLTVPVKEGTVTSYTHTMTGTASEQITLYENDIDNDEIEVTMVDEDDNFLYNINIVGVDTDENEIILIDDLDNYYVQIDNAYDFQSVIFTFGDGLRNKKVAANDKIKIKYAKTNGEDGNITTAGIITVISDTLYDGNGTAATLYVTNAEEISDGADYEDIDDIRANASNLFQSGYRAGSIYDWPNILESFSYINKVKVWTAHDEGDDAVANMNLVYIAAVTSDGTDLTTAQKTTLEASLESYKSPTEIPSFRDLEKIYLMFDITAVITNKAFDVVDGIIIDTLEDNYGVLNTEFQQDIYESNYISIIDSLDEILHHTTSVSYVEKDLTVTESNYELMACILAADAEDSILLTSGSASLWIYRKINNVWASGVVQIATSANTLTSFVGMNGYTISGSVINYSANTITYSVSTITDNPVTYGVVNPSTADVNGYLLSVSYKTNDGNYQKSSDIRLGSETNITDIDENFVFTTYSYE